jgi:hypothetical protein
MFDFLVRPDRVNDLYTDAVDVWLNLGDGDALEIASNATKTAGPDQKQAMIDYVSKAVELLENVESQIGDAPPVGDSSDETTDARLKRERIEILLKEIDSLSVVSMMAARVSMKPENEKALQMADVTYFRTRYPESPLWTEDK